MAFKLKSGNTTPFKTMGSEIGEGQEPTSEQRLSDLESKVSELGETISNTSDISGAGEDPMQRPRDLYSEAKEGGFDGSFSHWLITGDHEDKREAREWRRQHFGSIRNQIKKPW